MKLQELPSIRPSFRYPKERRSTWPVIFVVNLALAGLWYFGEIIKRFYILVWHHKRDIIALIWSTF